MLLVDYINKNLNTNNLDKLCFVHNLTLSDYENAQNKLTQKPCNIFPNINPIYLYYGKPLFNPCKKEEFDKLNSITWPMCLIIDAKSIPIEKSYPFDTGAYHGEPKWVGDDMTRFFKDDDGNPIPVCEFELGTELDTICRYIYTFFENNNNYFGSADNKWAPKCRDDIAICGEGKEELVVSKLYDFLRGTLKKLDNRCKVVEIQAVGEYNFSKVVKIFILPANNDDIIKSMPNATPITYSTATPRTSEDFINEITERFRSHLEDIEIMPAKSLG